MKIMFDVGANNGHDSLNFITNNPSWTCFAFEPTPKLYKHIKEETKKRKITDRYHVFNKAVSDYNGTSNFNIAADRGGGCSSLLEFSDDLHKTWSGRTDFHVTEQIDIDVITLEMFIDKICPINISQIDYFHCDAQGVDLNVLKGLGKYITFIKKGIIEVSNQNPLYKNQSTKKEAINFLKNNNFEILQEKSNDPYNNEHNIIFQRV